MKILINGICGKMGRILYQFVISSCKDVVVSEGVDLPKNIKQFSCDFKNVKLYSDLKSSLDCDVVVDFSIASSLDGVLDFCKSKHIPLVIATTGHTKSQIKKILKYSSFFPIYKSANMSQGITAMMSCIKNLTEKLADWDIEIIETHHRAKVDAPSGTAIEMYNAIKSVKNDSKMITNRGKGLARQTDDVGIMSIRGGNVIGKHVIQFMTDDEILTISHEALSKEVFARGAIEACKLICKYEKGIFSNKNIFD